MRITYAYRDKERVFETEQAQVMLGRASESIDLDLTPDLKVSRLHARIWVEDGQHWIEDLNSSRGTKVSGIEIKGRGKWQLRTGDTISIGETTLSVGFPEGVTRRVYELNGAAALASEQARSEPYIEITQILDATVHPFTPEEGTAAETAHRLEVLYDLPLQLAAETRVEALLQTIVDRLVDLIPDAARAALLLRDSSSDALFLKVCHSPDEPAVSETLARRAMAERKGFIWRRSIEGDISGSILQQRIEGGMYAPLLWQGEALGAICVDNQCCDVTFTEESLRLMLVVAQYAAMAVAGHQLQERLQRESAVKANLLRQFSPKTADRLLRHRGKLRLGGERTEVTILCSDIRGFTNLTKNMEPDDVVEMLNEYFSYLVPIVFAHAGTVDKYIGDAMLAVFGSPEPDPLHHEQAVRAGPAMQAAITKLNAARQARAVPTCDIGIGIHRGDVVQGFIGTADRMEFTVIGDAVNRASRYCAAARGGEVLISPELYESVWRIVKAERTTISTKHEGDFIAYRVRGAKDLGSAQPAQNG